MRIAVIGAGYVGLVTGACLADTGNETLLLDSDASRVAALSNPANPFTPAKLRETQAAARALGVTPQFYEVRDPTELDGAFAAMTKARAEALLVLPDPFIYVHASRIAALAAQSR